MGFIKNNNMEKIIKTEVGNFEEGVHFDYKGSKGNEIPVANLNHEIWEVRRFGKIGLESFRVGRNAIHNENSVYSNCSVGGFRDKQTGIWFGIPLEVDAQTGKVTWQRINLEMIESLDLSISEERKRWVVLSRCSYLEGSPNQISGKPLYKVYDHQSRAIKRSEEYKDKDRAIDIIRDLNEYELNDASIPLGVNPSAFDPITLRAELRYLVDEQKKFKEFLSFWDSPTRYSAIVFHKGLHRGAINRVLQQNGEMAYVFNGERLGLSEGDCIAYLSMPEKAILFKSIVVATESAEKMQKGSYNNKIPLADIQKEDEVTLLKKQIEELTTKLTEQKKDSLPEPKKQEEDSSIKVESNIDSMDETTLREYISANNIKIKGAHLMKPNALKKAIKESQSLV